MVPGAVHALDALVAVDDLENLADERTGLLTSILQRKERKAVSAGEWASGGWHTPGPLTLLGTARIMRLE